MTDKINNNIQCIKIDVSQRTRLRSSKSSRIQVENITWFITDVNTWSVTWNITERNINKALNNV